jgi:hypothetical protein
MNEVVEANGQLIMFLLQGRTLTNPCLSAIALACMRLE